MKTRVFIVIIIIMGLGMTFIFADTYVPYGEVSGIWNSEGSPYILEGNINIPVDSTLTIVPGVEVIFPNTHYITVSGVLISEGTNSDSIYFNNQSSEFPYMSFIDTDLTLQDSSIIKNVVFNGVGVACENSSNVYIDSCTVQNTRGIPIYNSSPIISNSLICNNNSEYCGGGIDCADNSNPIITNTIIRNNTAFHYGGGIAIRESSNPVTSSVIIEGNSSFYGGGIGIIDSNAILDSLTIINNSSGVSISDNNWGEDFGPHIKITNSTISGSSDAYAISSWESSLELANVVIMENDTGGVSFAGAELLEIKSSQIINNSTDTHCSAIEIDGYGPATVNIVNTLIAGNSSRTATGIVADDCHLRLTNVTITDNHTYPGELFGGVMIQLGCDLYVNNSIIYGNDGYDLLSYGDVQYEIKYSDIGNSSLQNYGAGVINADPLFSDNEYHLSEVSPCIDTGNPFYLFNEDEDPDNPYFALYPAMGFLRSDMGTYGGNGYCGYGVAVEEAEIPAVNDIQLSNYPNPFTSLTEIKIQISVLDKSNIDNLNPIIEIYNVKGQKVKSMIINRANKTDDEIIGKAFWNGIDSYGKQVSSGIYLYKLKNNQSPIKKMIYIK